MQYLQRWVLLRSYWARGAHCGVLGRVVFVERSDFVLGVFCGDLLGVGWVELVRLVQCGQVPSQRVVVLL